MNGILGNVHTSNHAVEIQLLKEFISRQQISSISSNIWPDTDMIRPLLTPPTKTERNSGGVYVHIVNPDEIESINVVNNGTKLLPPVKEKGFQQLEVEQMLCYFTFCFGYTLNKVLVLHYEAKSASFNGEIFGTYFSRQRSSSLVIVSTKDHQSS